MVKKRKSSRTNVGESAALCRENSQNAVLNGDREHVEKAEEQAAEQTLQAEQVAEDKAQEQAADDQEQDAGGQEPEQTAAQTEEQTEAPQDKKAAKADFIINNDGDFGALTRQVSTLVQTLLRLV